MYYEANLSAGEVNAIAALIGQELRSVVSDGWAAELRTSASTVRVLPEEVATPDAQHPHGTIDRLRLEATVGASSSNNVRVYDGLFGAVREASVLSTLVSFSPVVPCPPTELIPGVILPSSTGYGYVYYHPEDRKAASRSIADEGALINVDIAMELVTDNGSRIVLYTRGYFVNVSVSGLPNEPWAQNETFSRRQLFSSGGA